MIGQKAIARIQSQLTYLKRMHQNKRQLLSTLRNTEITMANANSDLKEVPLVSLRNLSCSSYQADSIRKYFLTRNNTGSSLVSTPEIIFLLNKQNLNHYYPESIRVLKFHLHKILLKNFFIKLTEILLSLTKKVIPKEDLEKQWGGPDAYKLITFIKNDFKEVVSKNSSVVIFFSAEWCHHCMRLRPHFGTAALMAKEANLPTVFATFDVNTDPDIADNNGVVGIPTIKYYKNGKVFSTFRGRRTADELFEYVKNPMPPPIESKKADL